MNIEHLIAIVTTAQTAGIDAAAAALDRETAAVNRQMASYQGLTAGATAAEAAHSRIGSAVTAAQTRIGSFADTVRLRAWYALDGLRARLGNIGLGGLGGLGSIGASIASGVGGIGGALGGALAGVGGALFTGISRAASAAGGVLRGAFTAGLSAVSAVASTTAGAVMGVTRAIAGLAQTAGLITVLLGVSAVRAAAKFQDELATINTIAFLTPTALEQVGLGIRNLASRTGESTSNMTSAYYDLLSAGVQVADAQGVLNNAVALGIGGLATSKEAVDLLTTAMNSYHLNLGGVTAATDVFAKTVELGKVTADQLAATFSFVAPIAAQNGISIQEVGASYAYLTAQGVRAQTAAHNMQYAILSLIKPNKDLADLQEKTGKSYLSIAQTQGLHEALNQLRGDAEKNHEPLARMLMSVQGLQYVLMTTGPNAAGFADTLSQMYGIAGFAAEQAEQRMHTLPRAIGQLRESFNSLMISLGTPLLDPLARGIEVIAGFVRGLDQWAQANQKLIQTWAPVVMGIAGVLALSSGLGMLGGLFARFGGGLMGMTGGLGSILSLVSRLVLPVGIAVGLFLLFQRAVQDNIAGLGRFAAPLEAITDFFGVLFYDVGAVVGMFTTFLGMLGNGVSVGNAFSRAFDRLPYMLGILSDYASRAIGGLGTIIVGLVPMILDGLGALIPAVIEWAAGAAGSLIEGGARLVGGLIEGMVSGTGGGGAASGQIGAALGRLISTIVTWAQRQAPILAGQLVAWGTAFVGWLGRVVPQLAARLPGLINTIVSWAGQQVGRIGGALGRWVDLFSAWVGRVLPPLLIQLGGLISRLTGWVMNQVPGILAALLRWASAFVGWLAPRIPGMLASLAQFGGRVLAWVGGQVGQIAGRLARWGLEFVGWLLPKLPSMLLALGQFLVGVVGWIITTGIPSLVSGVVQLAQGY